MSQENVESVKRAIDAFNRREFDRYAEFTTPDFEWFTPGAMAVGRGSFRGREGIEAYAKDIREAWDEYRAVPEEFHDLGDRVVVLGRMQGRGAGSGVQVDSPVGAIYDIRDGRIACARVSLDQGEALKAAGLES